MSDLFNQLRGDARLECKGEFTLDVEQAAHKMARFQFPQPQDFLPHLVAGLFRLGAGSLAVDASAARLTLNLPALELPKGLLQGLPEALFDEKSNLRRLAAAVQSLKALGLTRFVWLGNQRSQSYDYLTGKGQNWDKVRLEEIQIEGLSPQLGELALQELSKRGGWSRKPLRVGQRRFQWPAELDFQLGGFPTQCEWDAGNRPRLLLVMDEIVCEFRSVEAPFAWSGICYGEFSLDASLARVLDDELLAGILADIPGTFVKCLARGLSQAPPDEVLELLVKPLPAWLEPLGADLLSRELFRDQRSNKLSLNRLQRGTDPVYYAQESGELYLLDQTILVNLSKAALKCLSSFLGARLQEADPLVLHRLKREHNQRLWREQEAEVFSLSRHHWLYQSSFQHKGTHWLVGIPDDWTQMGATLVVWVEGRRLSTSQLLMQEICCEIACEVSPDQVNELWTGLADAAWTELEPAWNASVCQLLQSLTEGEQPQVELRNSLKKHLAGHYRPEDSYFRRTLLFQDWKGVCYSLDQLLKLAPEVNLGVVGPQFQPEQFPEQVVPEGVFLRNTGPELRILEKVRFSNVLILDYLLEDLQLARATAFTDSEITPQPAFGSATVSFCSQGLRLAPRAVEFPFAFKARLVCDELRVKALNANQSLGAERFQVVEDERSQQVLNDLKAGFVEVLRKCLEPPLNEVWLEWLREATLRGLCRDFLREVPCWPRYPQGLASLQEISQARVVHWCSGEGVSSVGGLELFLHRLGPGSQSGLMQAVGGGDWVCLDAEIAREQRQLEVLARAPWSPEIWGALAERKPDLWLLPQGAGRVSWLFQGRLLEEQAGPVPYGFHLAVACTGLDPRDRPDPEQLWAKCYALAGEYLAVQRQPMWEHWKAWRGQKIPEEIESLLQTQEWFATSRGRMSWKNLMLEPEIWLYPSGSRVPPSDLLVVFDRQMASELVMSHPRGHAIEETAQRLRAAEVLEGQLRQKRHQSEALKKYRHRLSLEFGEVALSGGATRELLWLGQEMQLPVENVPVGLAGYVTCVCQAHSLKTGGTVAELAPVERRQLFQSLAELLRRRVGDGPLHPQELDLFAEVCREVPELENLRWILCADGTYASLQQLRPTTGELLYWQRNYPLHVGGPALLPILATPLMVEVVAQVCGCRPQVYPVPWLHREVQLPSLGGLKSALSALGRSVSSGGNASLLGGMRRLLAGPTRPAEPETGRLLLEALQRRAEQLLSGRAREILQGYLRGAQVRRGRKPLWEFQGRSLVLHAEHPKLKPWMGSKEPPLEVQTCVLVSLVCAINAVNAPFTDEMEAEFLEHLADQIVESRPR